MEMAQAPVTGILEWRSVKVGRVRLKSMLRMEWVGGDHFSGGAQETGTGGVGEGREGDMVTVQGVQLVNRLRSFKMVVSCS